MQTMPAMPAMLDQQQKQLRLVMRHKRRALTNGQHRDARYALPNVLSHLIAYRYARRIAFYLPNDGEVDPSALIQQANAHAKACFLPVIQPLRKKRLHFVHYRPTTPLVRNRYGIQEPPLSTPNIAPLWTLDIIFVPLVAFDRFGTRLGMGGGYYDRTLADTVRTNKPRLIGLAHSCQEVGRLERSVWDVPMDLIVTEKELIVVKQTPVEE